MTARVTQLIHVGCRELGIDAETRKALQLRLVGKESLTDMTPGQRQTVLDHLKEKGFTPKAAPGQARPKRASRPDLRLIHVLWRKLGDADQLRDPRRAGLNKFIRARFEAKWGSVPADVDMLREWAQIDDVIQALKSWGERADIDFDWEAHRR